MIIRWRGLRPMGAPWCGKTRSRNTSADAGIGGHDPGHMPTDGTFRHTRPDGPGSAGHLAKSRGLSRKTHGGHSTKLAGEDRAASAVSAEVRCWSAAIPDRTTGSVAKKQSLEHARPGDTVVGSAVGGIGTAAIRRHKKRRGFSTGRRRFVAVSISRVRANRSLGRRYGFGANAKRAASDEEGNGLGAGLALRA